GEAAAPRRGRREKRSSRSLPRHSTPRRGPAGISSRPLLAHPRRNDMRVIPTCVALAALCVSGVVVGAQPTDFSKVEVTSTKLAEGVHVLLRAGGNIGVSSGKDGVFLVDDQYAPLTAKIKAALAP